MKKKFLSASLVLFSLISFTTSDAKTNDASLDQIVAVVNDDVVTRSELNQNLAIVKMQIAQAHVPTPSQDVLQKQALDQLINKKLQLQIAKQAGVSITDADLDKAVQLVAEQNQMSVNALYARLREEGMSVSDYRHEIHDQLVLQKLQQQEVISRITITPEEVNSFLHSKIWQNNGAKEYRIQDILIPFSDTPSSQEIASARIRANAILAQLHAGKSFRAIAQSESSEKHALEGGDLGWRKLPEVPSAFAEHLVSMDKKDIAGPIQTANGFHLIQLVDVHQLDQHEAAPDRKQVEKLLMQRKFEEAIQNWVSKLRSQAYIETNAVKMTA